MAKLNQQTMKTQYDGQYDTFCRKNHDYGNSFEDSLDQFGIVASIVRMSDKMKRLESLTDESKTQQVGSESLLDTLEDISNYAAMTACWLKGVREEDGETSCGPDMIDVIKYNVQDAKNVISRSAEMEKEFNKHIPSKVENIDPRNYVLNMLSNIFKVVQMKIEKNEMLVPLDISDEAGLIAKTIVESQTEEEGGAVINNYMCTRKDIPYELKDWVYGVIMRYLYYLKKERAENVEGENTILCRNQNIPLPKRLTYCSYREEKYDQLAALVLTGNIDFCEVSRIVNDYPNLRVAEKNHLLESIVSAAYKISDEPDNDKPEFLNKKFHIPDEILKDLKEPEEEPERKRTVLGMIFPFWL